jgi:hypothetical protein
MKIEDENHAIALITSNIGRTKRNTDPILLADCYKLLVEKNGGIKRNGVKKTAEQLGISSSSVSGWFKLTKLPNEIKEKISKGEMAVSDVIYLSDAIKDRDKQIEITKSTTGLPRDDMRRVVKNLKKNPQKTVEQAMQELKEEKDEENIFVVILPKTRYEELNEIADDRKIKINELIEQVIDDWLKIREIFLSLG